MKCLTNSKLALPFPFSASFLFAFLVNLREGKRKQGKIPQQRNNPEEKKNNKNKIDGVPDQGGAATRLITERSRST